MILVKDRRTTLPSDARLFLGDNLEVMRAELADASVNDALAGGYGEDFFWLDNKNAEKVFDADTYVSASLTMRACSMACDV